MTIAPPSGPGSPATAATRPPTGGDCPRCGAAYDAHQEYCLDCGLRLPGARGLAGTVADVRAGGPFLWAWPVLVTLVVAVLATAAVVVVQAAADDESEPLLVATTEQPTLPTVTEFAPTEAVPTEPVAPTSPAPPPPAAPATPPPAAGRLISWPAGVDGYTIVLASLPAPGGRREANQRARAAVDAGLADVGIIDSARFSSLHPGYYVVFNGVYGSMSEATQFVDDARDAGFDTAYARLIAS